MFRYIYIFKIYILITILITRINIFLIDLNSNNNNQKFFDIMPQTIYKGKNFHRKLKYIFKSRELFINDINITNEYIQFIKPLKNKNIINYNQKFDFKFYEDYFGDRQYLLDYNDFARICVNNKIINLTKFKSYKKPLISVILATYNKVDTLMKSVRSIQNQSLKNIEIIIVDDCSNDDSYKYYKYLLKTDPRIRIFYHLKNLGVWRTRIDGLLYSRGEYVIHFDTADMYADNLVLYDAYNVAKKYNLDSVKMVFIVSSHNFTRNRKGTFNFKENYTIIAYEENITKYNDEIFKAGHIWTRLTRSDIFMKGLYSLSDRVLNIYKNMWDDLWWNKLANLNSYNLLILKRYAYLFNRDGGSSEGIVKTKTQTQKDKTIHEFIYFLYFDYDLLPNNDDKKSIILKLFKYNTSKGINLNYFTTQFYILDDLIYKLLDDPFVKDEDKSKLKLILINSLKRRFNIA